jgi:hypothetical protein
VPVLITFNNGFGTPLSYTESGLTVISRQDHVYFDDNNGDGSPDLMNHSGCCISRTGPIAFDPAGWSNITSFSWDQPGSQAAIDNVLILAAPGSGAALRTAALDTGDLGAPLPQGSGEGHEGHDHGAETGFGVDDAAGDTDDALAPAAPDVVEPTPSESENAPPPVVESPPPPHGTLAGPIVDDGDGEEEDSLLASTQHEFDGIFNAAGRILA